MSTDPGSASITPHSNDKVDAFMAQLEHPFKETIQDLRFLILASDPRVREQIKWNAPSFLIEDYFATFKLYPPNAIQLVLHTGAKVKNHPKTFVIDDPHNLLKWATGDRCVLILKSAEHARQMREAVASIIKQWIGQL
jgi:hypothetical protein